ncbi:ABC transporter substrate-binding protein [Deinococcus yavapaiensis]|uniref:Carbohydrate ABC transporter substrate-binding protein (CUT1 family) n=1 Tax=Deinococcus yavapaiensis KR-236 TaxID=694435 RepID=A0A318SEK5_9DEIO|nr:ABC transporter substrate-binding protein [Deinococcus yavapaiensis]PYE56217.1 carbohydrate ABC transporter substrate-binding protein (CUT1 family) [Deinococcus yavapaiensis KR-236]
MRLSILLATLALGSASAAPLKVPFWHSMESVANLVKSYADDFNKSQDEFEIVPVVAGNYREALAKLDAAFKTKSEPVLFQAELTDFPKLAADGRLAVLDRFERTLPDDLVKDFYPAVWNYGELGGKRYGLPWNVSLPALYFNASSLSRAGVNPPKTYAELETVAAKLSGRGRRSLLSVADAWTFESMVAARGGSVVANGAPNFTSPEVVDALESLARMVSNGSAVGRSLSEAPRAAFDFVRGANNMALASVANWPDFQKLALLFPLGAAPLPCAKTCAVAIGGAQLVVLNSASEREQQGAVAFWRFLMDRERLRGWVEQTFYVPPRKSVMGLLKPFLSANPYRSAVFGQLDDAVARPKVAGYAAWRAFLEEAIERTIKNGVPARTALQDAQRKALAER